VENDSFDAHKIQASADLTHLGRKAFQFIEFDEAESLVAEIRRHPIGLLFIFVSGILIALVITVVLGILAANIDNLGFDFGSNTTMVKTGVMLVALILDVFVAIVTGINVFIYRANVVFLTNEKLAEVDYISLFKRKVIQHGIGQIEDVVVIQRGILPRIFDYGNLIVETAGESQKLVFPFIPRPSQNSQLIIKCHEDSIKQYGN
jgi:hypothetical protein